MTIQLGDLVREKVTGFEGIAIARTEWLNKCVRYNIQARELKEGKIIEHWFDQEQIDLIKSKEVQLETQPTGGGYRNDPVR